jgi:hypothetical protein
VESERRTALSGRAFEENRIAKLVRPILVRVQFLIYPVKRLIISKGAEQFMVTRARLVSARKDRIHDGEPAEGTDPLRRESVPGRDVAVTRCSVLQRPDNRCADRHDPSASLASLLDRFRGGCRDAIGFIEWQQGVQRRIAGR